MRVAITGAAGMLGVDVAAALRLGGHEPLALTRQTLDITDHQAVCRLLAEQAPEVVIHCAAWTDVDGCEQNPEQAFRVNALGTWHVAAACRQLGTNLIYVSTDFVFDGENPGGYTEFDPPRPINFYGASKLAGEELVRELVPGHFIVRSSWLFGVHGRNFVERILERAHAEPEVPVVQDQVGSPTYTSDLAGAVVRLLDSSLFGTYHITNQGRCSWAEFAQEILRQVGSDCRVKPTAAAQWPSPARRPRCSVLRNYALELQGKPLLRPWQEALAEYLNRRATRGGRGGL